MKLLIRGSRGTKVTQLQEKLIALGFLADGNAIGIYGPATEAAVVAFQKQQGLVVDGRVGQATWGALQDATLRPDPKRLTESALVNAANELEVPLSVIKAITQIESRGEGFHSNGRVVLLCERHWMRRYLRDEVKFTFLLGLIDRADNTLLSSTRGGYLGGLREVQRFDRFCQINKDMAIYGSSFGRFQIMGFNYLNAGCSSLDEFYSRMCESENEQLGLFLGFVRSNARLHKAMQTKDLETMARLFNGPKHAENNYVPKLRAHIARLENI